MIFQYAKIECLKTKLFHYDFKSIQICYMLNPSQLVFVLLQKPYNSAKFRKRCNIFERICNMINSKGLNINIILETEKF